MKYYFIIYPRTGGGVEAICNVQVDFDSYTSKSHKAARAIANTVFTAKGFDLSKYRVGLGMEQDEWYRAAVARGVRVL